jgi:hypothetical protein
MSNLRRYLFKLYATRQQAAQLREQRLMVADLRNGLLERIETVYRREGRFLSAYELGHEITALRRECPEWRVPPAHTLLAVADNLKKAFKAFFRRVKAGEERPGYPQYKSNDRPIRSPSLGGHGEQQEKAATRCCSDRWAHWLADGARPLNRGHLPSSAKRAADHQ